MKIELVRGHIGSSLVSISASLVISSGTVGGKEGRDIGASGVSDFLIKLILIISIISLNQQWRVDDMWVWL